MTGLSRRRVLQGAAWSVPLIAVTVAAPLAAASGSTSSRLLVSAVPDGAGGVVFIGRALTAAGADLPLPLVLQLTGSPASGAVTATVQLDGQNGVLRGMTAGEIVDFTVPYEDYSPGMWTAVATIEGDVERTTVTSVLPPAVQIEITAGTDQFGAVVAFSLVARRWGAPAATTYSIQEPDGSGGWVDALTGCTSSPSADDVPSYDLGGRTLPLRAAVFFVSDGAGPFHQIAEPPPPPTPYADLTVSRVVAGIVLVMVRAVHPFTGPIAGAAASVDGRLRGTDDWVPLGGGTTDSLNWQKFFTDADLSPYDQVRGRATVDDVEYTTGGQGIPG
ncbi:MAG: hypothetical protein Q7T71_08855 [Herbiconiux sp.]|nr:hypothetical protein [Herbiconiux sp.]